MSLRRDAIGVRLLCGAIALAGIALTGAALAAIADAIIRSI